MTHSYVSQRPGTFISKKGICLSSEEASPELECLVTRQEKHGRSCVLQPGPSGFEDYGLVKNVTLN